MVQEPSPTLVNDLFNRADINTNHWFRCAHRLKKRDWHPLRAGGQSKDVDGMYPVAYTSVWTHKLNEAGTRFVQMARRSLDVSLVFQVGGPRFGSDD